MPCNARLGIVLAVASFCAAAFVHGEDYRWVNEGLGDWSIGSNWLHGENQSGVPTQNDNAVINNGGTAQITDTRHAAGIGIAMGPGYSGTLQVTAGESTFGGISIGVGAGSSGSLSVSGSGTKLTAGTILIGNDDCGTGSFTQSGGTVETVLLDFGYMASEEGVPTGYYNLDGGHLKVTGNNGILLGDEGHGTIEQTGGYCEIAVSLTLGWKAYQYESVQYDAVGTYILEDGTVSVGSFCDIGGKAGGDGAMEIGGGSITIGTGPYQGVGQSLIVGCYSFKWSFNPVNDVTGTGSLLMTGGTLLSKGDCYVGGTYVASGGNTKAGGIGTITLQGDASMTVGSDAAPKQLVVGAFTYVNLASEPVGTGDFLQEGGTLTVWGKTYVGGRPAVDGSKPIVGGLGSMTVSGGAAALKVDLCVGCYTGVPPAVPEYGTGSFVQEGGAVTVDGSCFVGGAIGGQGGIGDFSMSDGDLSIGGVFSVGCTTYETASHAARGTGSATVSGGTFACAGDVFVGGMDGDRAGDGQMTISGGQVDLDSDLLVGISTVLLSDDTPCGAGTVAIEGGQFTVSGDVYLGGIETGQAGLGSVVMTGGEVSVDGDIFLGTTQYELPDESLRGWGTLQVGDEEAEEETNATIEVGGQVVFGPRSSFHVVEPSTQPSRCTFVFTQADSGLVIQAGADGSELDGYAKTEADFTAADDEGQVKTIEAAGVDPGFEYVTSSDFCAANFLLDKLSVGASGAGAVVTLKLLDDWDNQEDEAEAVYVNTVVFEANGFINLNGMNVYYLGLFTQCAVDSHLSRSMRQA